MECTVYALKDETIAKVYSGDAKAVMPDIQAKQRFYHSIKADGVSFALPEILNCGIVDG